MHKLSLNEFISQIYNLSLNEFIQYAARLLQVPLWSCRWLPWSRRVWVTAWQRWARWRGGDERTGQRCHAPCITRLGFVRRFLLSRCFLHTRIRKLLIINSPSSRELGRRAVMSFYVEGIPKNTSKGGDCGNKIKVHMFRQTIWQSHSFGWQFCKAPSWLFWFVIRIG